MGIDQNQEAIFEFFGWTVDCRNPVEITKYQGTLGGFNQGDALGTATGVAALIILKKLTKKLKKIKKRKR